MDSGARDFPRRKQPRNCRSSVQIRLHTAHDVMRCRTYWNPIAREIETGPSAHFRNQWESFVNEISIQSLQRQIHRLTRTAAFTHDRSRNPVTGSEVTSRLVPAHERLARRIHQLRAFAAQRL